MLNSHVQSGVVLRLLPAEEAPHHSRLCPGLCRVCTARSNASFPAHGLGFPALWLSAQVQDDASRGSIAESGSTVRC